MRSAMADPEQAPKPRSATAGRHRRRLLELTALSLFVLYFAGAYLLLPVGWRRYERRHPALDDAPRFAHTANGIPGDPLNVGLVATESEIHLALLAAKWFPADPITLRSSIRIAGSTVLRRSYEDAPVSSLYLWGRKQDLAFEQPVGHDARRRHHVRFWRSGKLDDDGKPLWIGAATFDTRVGFSHTTGQITHHISPDVDAERDKLVADLTAAGSVEAVDLINGFGNREGENGGGDRYRSDGRLAVVWVVAPAVRADESADR